MKEYFKKSQIYQKFVQEQETEAKNKEECEHVADDLIQMKKNFAELQQDVKNLENEVSEKQLQKDSQILQQFEDQEANTTK